MFSRDFIGVKNVKKGCFFGVQGVYRGFSWREGYLLGIVLVGKVFAR